MLLLAVFYSMVFSWRIAVTEMHSLSSYLMLPDWIKGNLFTCKIINTKEGIVLSCCINGFTNSKDFTPKSNDSCQYNIEEQSAVQDMLIRSNYISSWENDTDVLIIESTNRTNRLQSPINLTDSQPTPGMLDTLYRRSQRSTSESLVPTILLKMNEKMNQTVFSLSKCQRYHDIPLTNNKSYLCTFNHEIDVCWMSI
ncbi:uncharacterized protein LOC105251397 [Camponotus floridanus]|uniref:uncharacterized protein LOC105251397 n=1 Tax=Camponotus floridanus TaxID=104421 RepID=UPI00059B5C26|nr:uncharacterized protein LOC105251397 [Camponotus floridanus]